MRSGTCMYLRLYIGWVCHWFFLVPWGDRRRGQISLVFLTPPKLSLLKFQFRLRTVNSRGRLWSAIVFVTCTCMYTLLSRVAHGWMQQAILVEKSCLDVIFMRFSEEPILHVHCSMTVWRYDSENETKRFKLPVFFVAGRPQQSGLYNFHLNIQIKIANSAWTSHQLLWLSFFLSISKQVAM